MIGTSLPHDAAGAARGCYRLPRRGGKSARQVFRV